MKKLAVVIIILVLCAIGAYATLERTAPPPPPQQLQAHFIDVGQGDCILLDMEEIEVLIDGGEKPPGLVDYLRPYINGDLEAIVATHPDADHIGGLVPVLAAYKVQQVWHSGDASTSKTFAAYTAAVQNEGAVVTILRRGDAPIAGSLSFKVLSPVKLGSNTNNDSVVMTLSYGDIDFLFTGDTEENSEKDMLAAGIVPDVEILKVSHHGSRSATCREFLEKARPEVAVYQAAAGNSYGHPHIETITNLKNTGTAIYGTDTYGTVIVATDGRTYTIKTSKN